MTELEQYAHRIAVASYEDDEYIPDWDEIDELSREIHLRHATELINYHYRHGRITAERRNELLGQRG